MRKIFWKFQLPSYPLIIRANDETCDAASEFHAGERRKSGVCYNLPLFFSFLFFLLIRELRASDSPLRVSFTLPIGSRRAAKPCAARCGKTTEPCDRNAYLALSSLAAGALLREETPPCKKIRRYGKRRWRERVRVRLSRSS